MRQWYGEFAAFHSDLARRWITEGLASIDVHDITEGPNIYVEMRHVESAFHGEGVFWIAVERKPVCQSGYGQVKFRINPGANPDCIIPYIQLFRNCRIGSRTIEIGDLEFDLMARQVTPATSHNQI